VTPLSLPIAEARRRLTSLAGELEKRPKLGAVAVTRRGKPVLALLSWDLYESIMETMEILSDPEMLAAFRQGVREMNEGKGIPWEKAKRRLGP